MLSQKLTNIVDDFCRKFDLEPEIPQNFIQQTISEHNLMLAEAYLHNGFTKPTSSKGSNNNIYVKDNLIKSMIKAPLQQKIREREKIFNDLFALRMAFRKAIDKFRDYCDIFAKL